MSTHDAALDFLNALVLESGDRWGQAAVDVQIEDARAILDEQSPTPYHALTRARSFSKSTDLAGIALDVMETQAPTAARLYGIAADRDQGRVGLLDAAEGFIRRTGLEDRFKVESWRITHRHNGSTLDILAADAPGAWGLRPYFVVVDEIAQWAATTGPRLLFEAVSSAMAKMPGARLAILTTAGDPSHWSRKVFDHAETNQLWRVHEHPGPPPWMNAARLEEQRRRLPESSYRRLFMNEWTASEDRLTNLDDLAACTVLDGPLDPAPGIEYVIGVDVGLKRDRTVACVCHAERVAAGSEDELADATKGVRVVLDRINVWQGTRKTPVVLSAVEDWIRQACRTFNGARVCIDPWQAIGSAQRLRDQGIAVDEFSFSSASVGRLATTMHLLLRNRRLSLPDDKELLDELANVRLRETSPGVLRMDHDPGQHDDRAIALALASHALVDKAPAVIPPVLGIEIPRSDWEPSLSAFGDSRTFSTPRRTATLPANAPPSWEPWWSSEKNGNR